MTTEKNTEQMEIAERLQLKWLQHMEDLLDSKEITSTDMATLSRLLASNGWTLDPARLPSRLKDKLTSEFDPTAIDEQDGVIPIRGRKVS